jgi:hypothetical protein
MISRLFVTAMIQSILWLKGIPQHGKFVLKQGSGKVRGNDGKRRGMGKGNNERNHGRDKKGNDGH